MQLYDVISFNYITSVYVHHKADVSTCLASKCEFHNVEFQNDPHHIESFYQI